MKSFLARETSSIKKLNKTPPVKEENGYYTQNLDEYARVARHLSHITILQCISSAHFSICLRFTRLRRHNIVFVYAASKVNVDTNVLILGSLGKRKNLTGNVLETSNKPYRMARIKSFYQSEVISLDTNIPTLSGACGVMK